MNRMAYNRISARWDEARTRFCGSELGMLDNLGFEPLVTEFMNLPTRGRDKGRYAVVARRR